MQKMKTPQRRTKIKDLPKKEKELSKQDQKKIKGGMKFDYKASWARKPEQS